MSQVILIRISFITPGWTSRDSSLLTRTTTPDNRGTKETTYSVDGVDDETGYIVVKEVDKGQEYLGYSTNSTSTRAVELKGQLNYNRLFNDKHRVGGMLMYYQRDYINGSAGSAITSLPYRKQGVAARATYDYRDTYFGEFNLGYNGSENFPKEQRFGFSPPWRQVT